MSDTVGSLIDEFKIRNDLSGKRFGKLLVIRPVGKSNNGEVIWECVCDCGNEYFTRPALLSSGKTKSCGCLRRLPHGEGSFNSIYSRYKTQARLRNLNFELSKEEFRKLVSQNCYYCGIEPQQGQKTWGNFGIYLYNGIDRLDSSRGYTKENTVSCCGKCNRAKDIYDFEQYKKWIKRSYLNLYKKITEKTPGELVDSLITADIKCFFFQEKMLDVSLSNEDRVKYGNLVVEMNKRRNQLMRSIDTLLDFSEDMVTPKTYLSSLGNEEKQT